VNVFTNIGSRSYGEVILQKGEEFEQIKDAEIEAIALRM
jgi:hypothetical protein